MTSHIFDICTFCAHSPASSGDGRPCTMCPASGREIATRSDQIRAMSDEELADLFYGIQVTVAKRILKKFGIEIDNFADFSQELLDYIKQPAEESTP